MATAERHGVIWVQLDGTGGALDPAIVYNIFPGTIFALFYDQFQVFQIWPGPTPDTSTTIQSIYTPTAKPTLVSGRQEVALHHFRNACNRYAGI